MSDVEFQAAVDLTTPHTVDVAAPPAVTPPAVSTAPAPQPSTTPAPAAATAAPAASSTTIKLGDKQFEVKGSTPAQIDEIYASLPTEYKQRADAYKAIAKNVERVIQGLPEGMTISQAYKKYTQAFDSTGKFLKERSEPWMKQFDELNIPGFSTTRTLDRAADKAGRMMDGFTAPLSDAMGIVGNVGKLFDALGAEAKGAAKGALGVATVSDEQAKALGTLFAAAEFHESAVRKGLPLWDVGTNNLIVKYPGDATRAAMDWVGTTTLWEKIVACGKFVMDLFSNAFGEKADKNLSFTDRMLKAWENTSFDAALAEAKAERAAKNPDLTYEERVVARVQAGEADRAAAKLKAAKVEEIIGVPAGTVDAASGKAPFVATNGSLNQVTPDASGKPEVKPVLTAEGKTVGRGDRVQDAAVGVFPAITAAVKAGDPLAVTGVVVGTGIVAQGLRGTAEGVARQIVSRPEARMEAAIVRNNTYAGQAEALREGRSGLRFWENDASREARAQKLDKKAVDAANEALKHLETAENRAAHAGKFTAAAQADVPSKGVLQSIWNAPRRLGRGLGDAAGFVAEGVSHKTIQVVRSSVATFVVDAAPIVAGLGKGFTVAAKVVRGIPGVGILGGGAVMGLMASAHADTVDGKKLSYFEQLDYDHKQGRVTDKEYAYYRSLQTGYIASGIGGLVTAGASEVVKVGLENIDPVKMDKYLPESLVSTVKGLVVGDKPTGALPADPALAAVGATATQNARMAQAVAGSKKDVDDAKMVLNRTPFAKTDVKLGSMMDALPTSAGNLPYGNFAQGSLPPMV